MRFLYAFSATEEAVKSKGQNQGTISTEECMPPNYVFKSDEMETLLEPLYPANTVPKVQNKMSFNV